MTCAFCDRFSVVRLRPFVLLLPLLFGYCAGGFGDPGLGDGRERFSVFFSEPGKDQDTMIDKHVDDELVKLIDGAERYMYLSVYNFNKTSIVQAVLRAYQRNIDVRVVGDIDEFYTSGYQTMYFNNINMTLGNAAGIQHNKFAVVDDRYVFMGTGNLSDTDMVRNNNNWYIIENAQLVKLYKDEFLQMHNGLFAAQKRQRSATSTIIINNHPLELYFSPYQGDEAMDRIITLVESAKVSIHYMIFAHTHDELDAAMVKMARQRGIPVYGIHDSTFVLGVSEEAPKMYSAGFNNDGSMSPNGPFVRWDGNENTSVKNNPAHGGKMHCKTVLIDAGTPNARMATGSFNWSNNAINNNDENVIIVNQPRIVNTIYEQWKGAWGIANDMALKVQNRGHIAATGDIVITEVGWAGTSDGSSTDKNDDFVEILNNTCKPLDLSHWAIQWGTNDKRNLYPVPDNHNWYYENKGSCPVSLGACPAIAAEFSTPRPNIICPGQVRLFYNKKPSAFAETGADEQIVYDDQGGETRNSSGGSLSTEHFKFSGTKNFKISGSAFKIRLYDKAMNLIDEAGDGLAAPAGLYSDYTSPKQTYSMERRGCSAGSGGAWPPATLPACGNTITGSSPAAWFTHPAGQTYSCAARQDGYTADACVDRQANTYSSAGYIYSTEANPVIRKVEAISASQVRVTFDGNVSGASSPNNCLDIGSLAIRETEDTTSACPQPVIASHTAGTNNSEIIVTLATPAMVSPTCRYNVAANATCRNSAGKRVGAFVSVATSGGVSSSDDGGATFVNRTTADGLGSNSILSLNRIGNSTLEQNAVYFAATSSGLGFSADGGARYTNITTAQGLGTNDIRQGDAYGNYLFVATAVGLNVSSNSGTSYGLRTTTNGLGANDVRAVRAIRHKVYVATSNGLSISADLASSFSNKTITDGLGNNDVRRVAIAGDRIFAATGGGLSISSDDGATFTNRTTGNGLGSNVVQDAYVVGELVLAATTGGLSISYDGGATFANKTTANGLGANDVRGISVIGDTFFAATAAGLSISTNAGTSFTNVTTGLGSVILTGVVTAGDTHFNGYSSFATAIINEVRISGTNSVVPFGTADWAEIKVTGAGSLRGLKLFYYNDEEMRQIYEFGDIHAAAGSLIAIGVSQGSVAQPDRTQGSGTFFPMTIQLRDTAGFDGTDGTFILTYCATGENDTVNTGLAECALPYKGILDALYYTDRDGTLTQAMVAGPLNHFYNNLQSFWPMAERPIYGLNDRTTQLTGACVAADSSAAENGAYLCTSSGAGVSRSAADNGSVRNAGKSAWKNFAVGGLSPVAANTGW